ncbi:unnamed protein product [Timema podura]|uniref:Protein sleepless n=1 Tax=Timema podura TaxID=61482 RepID=A0ABN7NGW7_TIMPD|nr:unnamed protein product [Timema podura]
MNEGSVFVAGQSIRCYHCNSEYDPRCADPFDAYSLGDVNCSMRPLLEHLQDYQPIICRKTVQKDVREETYRKVSISHSDVREETYRKVSITHSDVREETYRKGDRSDSVVLPEHFWTESSLKVSMGAEGRPPLCYYEKSGRYRYFPNYAGGKKKGSLILFHRRVGYLKTPRSRYVYGKVRVVRGCGYIEETSDRGCIRRAGTHDVMANYCSCKEDLCNAANPIQRPLAAALALLAALRATVL